MYVRWGLTFSDLFLPGGKNTWQNRWGGDEGWHGMAEGIHIELQPTNPLNDFGNGILDGQQDVVQLFTDRVNHADRPWGRQTRTEQQSLGQEGTSPTPQNINPQITSPLTVIEKFVFLNIGINAFGGYQKCTFLQQKKCTHHGIDGTQPRNSTFQRQNSAPEKSQKMPKIFGGTLAQITLLGGVKSIQTASFFSSPGCSASSPHKPSRGDLARNHAKKAQIQLGVIFSLKK